MPVFKPRDTSPLSLQLSTLAQQVDEVLAQFRKSNSTGPLVGKMTQLSILLGFFKRQISESEEELRSLRALAGIGEVINSSLDLDAVLRIVMDTIIRLVVAERGFLMLPNDQNELTMRVARNWEQESISPADFAISRTIISQVAQDRKPILTTNAQQDPRFVNQDSIVAFNLRSILCVPMLAKAELVGVVYVDNRIRSGIFTRAELDLLTAFGNQASVAIENARLFASLQHTLTEVTESKLIAAPVVSPDTASGITHQDAQRIEITSLSVAIRGFGSISRQLPIDQSISIFNQYLGEVVKAVQAEGGTIDKVGGEGVTAWFNAPAPQTDHPLRAIRAALGVRQAILKLHASQQNSYRLSFGAGIHSGEVLLGMVGWAGALNFTAVGDCLNIARCIQENAAPGQIKISSQVYKRVKDTVEALPVDPIQVAGQGELLEVYEVSK